MKDEEKDVLCLETYAKAMEDRINSIIALRNDFYCIMSLDQFFKEKEKIIQSLFEIESILRDSSLFICKNYLKIKQTLQLNAYSKENNGPCALLWRSSPISDQLSLKDELRGDDNSQPITFKGKDKLFGEDSTFKDDSFAKRCQPTTTSNPISTEKECYDQQRKVKIEMPFDKRMALLLSNQLRDVNWKKQVLHQGKLNTKVNSYQNAKDYLNSKHSSYKSIHPKNIHSEKGVSLNPQINCSKQSQAHTIDNDLLPQKRTDLLSKIETTKTNASKVADIIMKLSTNQTSYCLIVQLFGNDALDRLMATPPNEALIDSVEKSIEEIERLEHQDKDMLKASSIEVEYGAKAVTNVINNDYTSFSRKLTNEKKKHHSTSFKHHPERDFILLALNKKTPNADDLLAYQGFGSRGHSKKRNQPKTQQENTSKYSVISSSYCNGISPSSTKFKLPKKQKVSLTKNRNNKHPQLEFSHPQHLSINSIQ